MPSDINILIADDSAPMRQTVKGFLLSMGYSNLHTASNGQEALQKCRQHDFKIVFLDWNMPEMDGLVFLKVYRQELNCKDTAVIMLTANSDRKDILTALETGATAYITKPVSQETIQKQMKQAEKWLDSRGQK